MDSGSLRVTMISCIHTGARAVLLQGYAQLTCTDWIMYNKVRQI